jgi:uncharacterized protein (DUF2236 family)
MLRRIHGERAVALAGPRALLMQAAHPLATAGLLAHSGALDEPYERLARTADTMRAVWFGSRADADRAARRVRAMHRRVGGRLTAAAGPYPAGTGYRADAPELLLGVLYTLADSALVVYRTYVGPLSHDERAAFWDDYKVVGRLFGLRPRDMPESYEDMRAYGEEMLDGDRLLVTDWARERARRIVLEPPVPLIARPLRDTVAFITIALLPDPIRRQYLFSPLPPTFIRRALVAGGAEYVKRAVIPFLPDRLRRVPAARAA